MSQTRGFSTASTKSGEPPHPIPFCDENRLPPLIQGQGSITTTTDLHYIPTNQFSTPPPPPPFLWWTRPYIESGTLEWNLSKHISDDKNDKNWYGTCLLVLKNIFHATKNYIYYWKCNCVKEILPTTNETKKSLTCKNIQQKNVIVTNRHGTQLVLKWNITTQLDICFLGHFFMCFSHDTVAT